MDKRELICIGCPLGCNLEVEINDDKKILVRGNNCKIGEEYGIKECTNPTRIVTTTVFIEKGQEVTLPVKTSKDIPKDKIFECLSVLKSVVVTAPINIGDVIVSNLLDTGADIVATKRVNAI